MKEYDICFHQDSDSKLHFHFSRLGADTKTVVGRLNENHLESYFLPHITIFFRDETQLVQFKNSMIQAFDSYWRRHHGR